MSQKGYEIRNVRIRSMEMTSRTSSMSMEDTTAVLIVIPAVSPRLGVWNVKHFGKRQWLLLVVWTPLPASQLLLLAMLLLVKSSRDSSRARRYTQRDEWTTEIQNTTPTQHRLCFHDTSRLMALLLVCLASLASLYAGHVNINRNPFLYGRKPSRIVDEQREPLNDHKSTDSLQSDATNQTRTNPRSHDKNIPQQNQTPLVNTKIGALTVASKSNVHEHRIDSDHVQTETPSTHPVYTTGSAPRQMESHTGSRFANGTLGYIADPTALRRNLQIFLQRQYPNEINPLRNSSHYWNLLTDYYPEYRNGSLYGMHNLGAPFVCNFGPGQSFEDDGGYKLLTEKISFDMTPLPPIKVLCSIYTHRTMRDLARAQALTWGHKCDGFLAFSTEMIEELGMLNILHAGDEMYDNMWQKVRSIWAYVHNYYLNDYDFFHLGGDDLYLIVENLKRFLGRLHLSTSDATPLFLGQWIHRPGDQVPFVAGAPGYTLNRAALNALVTKALPICQINTKISAEDRMVSKCFRSVLNVTPGDTRDDLTGEQQYHDCDPHHLYTFRASTGKASFHSKAASMWETLSHPSIANTTAGPKHELEAAAKYSVSFHNIYHPVFVARIHSLVYKETCPSRSVLGRALRIQSFV